jgi:hypothetical protein
MSTFTDLIMRNSNNKHGVQQQPTTERHCDNSQAGTSCGKTHRVQCAPRRQTRKPATQLSSTPTSLRTWQLPIKRHKYLGGSSIYGNVQQKGAKLRRARAAAKFLLLVHHKAMKSDIGAEGHPSEGPALCAGNTPCTGRWMPMWHRSLVLNRRNWLPLPRLEVLLLQSGHAGAVNETVPHGAADAA